MNRDQLRAATEREGIRADSFSLDGGLPLERYVLTVAEGGWIVYYSERGERVGEQIFDTEDEACSHLYLLLLGDPSSRAR
jgi:hypothetical protein